MGLAISSASRARNFSTASPRFLRAMIMGMERSPMVSGSLPIPAKALGQNTPNSLSSLLGPTQRGTVARRSKPALSKARSASLPSSPFLAVKTASTSSRKRVGISCSILRKSTASVGETTNRRRCLQGPPPPHRSAQPRCDPPGGPRVQACRVWAVPTVMSERGESTRQNQALRCTSPVAA
jgi:hypothetical protein